MLKKLAVPFLMLSLAAFGCSSSTTKTDGGTGGKGGGGGTGGGAGGTGGGAGGTGGGAGGTGGAHDGGNGGTGGATDSGSGDGPVLMASCTVTTNDPATAVLSAADFCTNLQASCTGSQLTAAYAGTMCATTYGALSTASKHCQSYHLCWGVEGGGGGPHDPVAHCPHTQGLGPCLLGDASAGQ